MQLRAATTVCYSTRRKTVGRQPANKAKSVSQQSSNQPSAILMCSLFTVFDGFSMGFFTFLLMDSAVSAVLRKELGVRGAARKFSVNRHSLPTRLLLIERSERDDLDSGRNHRL